MLQAAAAARLLNQEDDFHARRALETAISVSYARPWIDSNRGGKLKAKWLPADDLDRDLHNRLLDLRHKTYAHTDPAGGRSARAHVGPDTFLASARSGFRSMPTTCQRLPIYATGRQRASRRRSSTRSMPHGTRTRCAPHPPLVEVRLPARPAAQRFRHGHRRAGRRSGARSSRRRFPSPERARRRSRLRRARWRRRSSTGRRSARALRRRRP